ncbi:histidine kinase [Dictyobacter sp. S3.2.2.5]|uniref:histidine kinase n=1 Tax=Dictyobacter halimunensis TaxID=3026934 RepID=A0ABQ6FKM7_9CHLR|nr:histidine kinase [Dictyobacter sp. S3.2.2.5]
MAGTTSMFSVDLATCDQEPIHIPGSIQPHGVLLALGGPDLTIVQVSNNSRDILGVDPEAMLGTPLKNWLAAEHVAALHRLQLEQLEQNPVYLFTVTLFNVPRRFDSIVHRVNDVLVLELEPIEETGLPANVTSSKDVYYTIQTAFARLQQASSVSMLSQQVAEHVRALTGFDRVMIYRFEADGHGVVYAEARREDLSPYLNLHYPASDIPAQARRLYQLNWLRLIPDRNYRPAALIPSVNPLTNQPLDMSQAVLRSVSPIHLEYLGNMGVAASMSISLIVEDTLWGLIACHHYTPRYVPYDLRTACELIGRIMSLQLPLVEEREEREYVVRLQNRHSQLIEAISTEKLPLADAFTRHAPTALEFIAAGGVAVCVDGTCRISGQTPSPSQIEKLLDWLMQQPEDQILVTDKLPSLYPAAAAFQTVASGLLALVLSRSLRHYILWFRPEIVQTVHWGGDPHKPVEVARPGFQLSPRRSFEVWKQQVYGMSQPWQHCEVEAVDRLRSAIIHALLRQAEELARVNRELERSNIELDTFAYAASHDLKEPLRGIHNYAHFLLEDYGEQLDEEGVHKLRTLVSLSQRMEDLMNSLLYYSRVGRGDLSMRETDLNLVLQQAMALLQARIEESGACIRVRAPLPSVVCDGSRVGEVFMNLIGNAIKYAGEQIPQIEIGVLSAREQREHLAYLKARGQLTPQAEQALGHGLPVFYIRDNGIGISSEHFETIFRIFKRLHGRDAFGGGTGAGLTIVKKIVELHGGTIWVESVEGQGSTFFWTLRSIEKEV